jgi:hypothetical protein
MSESREGRTESELGMIEETQVWALVLTYYTVQLPCIPSYTLAWLARRAIEPHVASPDMPLDASSR